MKDLRSSKVLYKDPTKFADALLASQGALVAMRICRENGRKMVGKDEGTPNPHSIYFRNAAAYLRKRLTNENT